MPKVAVVQIPPLLLDRVGTLARAVDAIAEAARSGAGLVVFPEAYVPGYPQWIRRAQPRDAALASEIHARLLANAVDSRGNDWAPSVRRRARTA